MSEQNNQNLQDFNQTQGFSNTESFDSAVVESSANSSQIETKTENKASSKSSTTKSKKPSLIIQAVKNKKGLYTRISNSMMKEVSRKIAEGKTASINPDKFIFDLIERGLKDLEKGS